MQLVVIHHTVEQFAVFVRQLAVDVQIADFLPIRKLCEEQFSSEAVNIRVHGNVFTSVAFLEGVAAEELRAEELAFQDPLYPLLITVRAQKTAH